MSKNHPVEAQLRQLIADRFGAVVTYRAVLALGRPYVGLPRPQEFRRGRPKQCFRNAALLALDRCGIYVEGFACSNQGSRDVMHHAWITVSGSDAIDVTWATPEDCHYFGIPMEPSEMRRWVLRRRAFGILDPLEPELLVRSLDVFKSREKIVKLLAARTFAGPPKWRSTKFSASPN
jgi:hypothetical protein